MWKAIIGKSFERSEASTSQSSRRKDEGDKTASRRRSSESIVSSSSARKPTRGEDRDRGFNPTSTSYSSTSRTAYPGTAPASVASSYATASSNQADQTMTPPGLVRNASLADKMPKPRGSRDERRRDSNRSQRGERRERSTSRERRSNYRERTRSQDREDKKRSTRRAYDEQVSDRDLARGLSGFGDGYNDDQSTARAGDYSVQASGNFGAQVGSSGFTQFPGQYDGGLPAFAPEPSPAPVNMSSHVPDQFPGQFPSHAAAPYRPPLAATEGGPGLAAEYYGDTGESVAQQPGVRPQAPTLIVGAEPHLQAASPIAAPPPEPSTSGNVGAAASFFSGADDYQPIPSSKPPKPGKQSKPENSSKPNRPSGAAVITGSAALGFAAASSSPSTAHPGPGGTPNTSFVQQSSNIPVRPSVAYPPSITDQGTSHHSSSAPAVPTLGAAAAGAAAGYMIGHHSSSQQSRLSGISPSGNAGIHVTASPQRPDSQRPHSQARPTYVPMVSGGRPDHPGKHSSQSNVPLYAAGLAGTAGVAAAAYQSHHSPPHNTYDHSYTSGSMAQRHRHRGPLSKLIDFLRDPDGVAGFEEYTEYIGVCKHCFSPGSSPRDAPRKHHYRRRRSDERYGSSTRIDKESRYWSSDGESRRKNGKSWLATGMAGYGLGKIGKSFSRAPENDFNAYSVRSGRANQSSWSLGSRTSEHSDKRGHTSHGVAHRSSDTGSRVRSRSRERVESGITNGGKLYKRDRHGSSMTTYEARRRRSRSRSTSRDRRSGLTGAAIGAMVGSSMATSAVRHRSRSPEVGFATMKRRSGEHSPSSGSKHGKGASHSSRSGLFASSSPYINGSQPHSKSSNTASGGLFSSRPEKPSRRKKKKKSKGFFSFSNSSSSSSDGGLAYGFAPERRRSSKMSTAKSNHSRDTNAAILGLGAAVAALAATDHSNARQRRRRPDLVEESRKKHGKRPERSRKSGSSSMSSSSEDGVWEDASEDDDSSSPSSGLAYGGAARRSQESLLSEASATSKWGWRWGSSKKKKDPGYPVRKVGQTIAPAIAGSGGFGAHLPGDAAAFHNRRDVATSSASSLPSMQHVYPVPTPDPSRFDVSRQSSTMSSNLPIVTSRPAAIPLQQPQPITPVSSAVYTTQAPYGHSYSAPTGPPVFSRVPQGLPTVTDIKQATMTSSPDRTIPGSFPFHQSDLERLPKQASSGTSHRRRDSSPISRTKIVEPTSSSRRKRASTQDQGSSVRFDVVEEQADKERRNRRRQEEDIEATRQQVLLLEERDREEREKQRKRRLKEEEDADQERFRLEAFKKQSERHNRDKRRIPEKEDITRDHASRHKAEEEAAIGGERQRRELGSSNDSLVGTKRDVNLRSETQSLGNHGEALEESKNLASWATPGVVGAVGAVIVAAAAKVKASSAEDYQTKRRNEQSRSGDKTEIDSGKTKSSKRQSPSQASDDIRDHEAQVARKVAPNAAPSSRHEDYATYFAPLELLARTEKQPARDDEGAASPAPHIITIEPSGRKSPCYSPADASNEAPYGHGPSRVSQTWSVPAINVIKPTPPHSIAGSSRGDASPVTRPEDATIAEINQHEKPSTASRVTWGEPETVEYTVITPLESREEFISNPPTPPTLEEDIEVVTIAPSVAPAMAGADSRGPILPVDEVIVRHMPGEFGDDLEFAATLAAGLEDTGFDPALVIDDPTYRRRDSPPGSESTNFYRQPFFETVTDLGLDSPGTEGAPPQRGFIEGELPSTPQDEEVPTASGDFDIPLKNTLTKKEKRKQKQKQAVKGPDTNGLSTAGSSLSKLSTKDRILREPDEYSGEPESMVTIPREPSDGLVGPAIPSKPEKDHSRDQTERARTAGRRSASCSYTDRQGYFDDQPSIPTSSIYKTEQDVRVTDLAASVPLPEVSPDELGSLRGLSMDDLRQNRNSTNEAGNPISRHDVAPMESPDTKGIRSENFPGLTHKLEEFETRSDANGSSQDSSPSRYAESSTRVPPETQEDVAQGRRKKKSKRVSVPDEWSDRDTRSISAPTAEPDEYQRPRKSKKKSKRDSVGFDDAVSAVSAPAAIEGDKTSRNKGKKDKKGGLFNLFSSSKSYEDPPEATTEDFQEPKKSKRKSKDRSSSRDVYDVHGAAAQSVGDLSQIGQPREDSKDGKSQKSKGKEERRRSRKENTVESGITTQDLPSKDEHHTSPTEETRRGTRLDNPGSMRAESQDNMMSFLDIGNDIPSVPDGVEPALSTQTWEDLSQAPQPALQFSIPSSEPSSPASVRTPSPQRSDLAEDAGKSSQDSPLSSTFPAVPREQRIPGLQFSNHISVSPAIPSPTAIPIHFRTPRPSVGFVHPPTLSSPATALESPSSVVPRTRHARPGSTEFRPLWLVERHKSREQFDPEEQYPSLPSSKATSRSSSVHVGEDVDANDEMTFGSGDANFMLGVNIEHSLEPQEFLDSQQPTPVAASFPLTLQHDENSEKELHNRLDAEYDRDAHVNRPDNLNSAPSSPSLRSLVDTTSNVPDIVLPADFKDLQDLPPLPPSSDSSPNADDELLSSLAIKDAAVAMGTLVGDAATALLAREQGDKVTSLPSDLGDHIHSAKDIVRPLDTARAQQESIESAMEPELPAADKPSGGPYWQAESSTTNTVDQGATVEDDLADPVLPSQAANLMSVEQQRELQEQDAQDAVDTWFAPPTSKKEKKEKQSKKQKNLSTAKNNGAFKPSPSASTSSSGYTAEAPLVAVEALTEEHNDAALPEGLDRSQSDQKELSSTPVPPLHREADQAESGAQVLPTLQSIEEDAEWSNRNQKSKKGKGKKRDNKLSKLPTKSIEAVLSTKKQAAQLVPESSGKRELAYPKLIRGGEDGQSGKETRALEATDNLDITPQDELSIALPSVTPLELEALSEYVTPGKKSKKDKKKAKQARQVEPAEPEIEPTSKDPSSHLEIDTINDGSKPVQSSSQSEERESEAMSSVSSSGHVTETSSDPALAAEVVIAAKRKTKAKKKHKLDLRRERDLSFGDSNPPAEEDTPTQQVVKPASTSLERSIAADSMEHTEPVLEPEATLEETATTIGSSAAPDERTQQDLDPGHASAIQAKETTRSNAQELSPLISAYPHPDDAPSTAPLEQELPRPLSLDTIPLPEMIPLPEDEDLGLYDVPADEELLQETEVSHVMPNLKAETESVSQENSRSSTLEPRSATPGGFPTDQKSSIQVAPEMIPLPPDDDAELDRSPALKSSVETPGAFPIEESRSTQTPLHSDQDVKLDVSATLKPLSETPGAFPTGQSPSIKGAPGVEPLLGDGDMRLKNRSEGDGPQLDIAAKAFDGGDFISAVTAKTVDDKRPDDGSLTTTPLADDLPGVFPTKHDAQVQVLIPEMAPLPPDEGESRADLLDFNQSRSDTKSPVAKAGHMRQEDEILRAMVPDTDLPGAFPNEEKSSVEVTPDQVPLPRDENMDLYNPQDDDESSIYTRHDAEGIQQTLRSSMLATPALELPGAFPAVRSTPVQDAPGYFPSPATDHMGVRGQQDELQSSEYSRSGTDDYNDGSRRRANSLELATPAMEIPGAFLAGQSTPVLGPHGDVRSRPNKSVDLRDQQDDLQLREHSRTGDDNYDDGIRPEAISVGLATPAVEIPGAFPAGKSTLVEIAPTDIPLPPDENMDVYEPLGDDQYIATPAVELPGAFPEEQRTLLYTSPDDIPLPPDEDMDVYHLLDDDQHVATPAVELPGGFPGDLDLETIPSTEAGDLPTDLRTQSQSTIDDEQRYQNAVADDGDVHSDLLASMSSLKGQMSPKTIIQPVLKSLISAVSTSTHTEKSPSATSPELIPLPDSSDLDLDDTANDRALTETNYDGDIVSAAELGLHSSRDEFMQQEATSFLASTKLNMEELGSISSEQGPQIRSLSTSAVSPYDVTNKPLLPEALPLPQDTAPTPQHLTEWPVPDNVDHENVLGGVSRSPANVDLNPDSATWIPLPEDTDLELLSPEMIPLPESADTVYSPAETTALADAAYVQPPPSEMVPRPQDPEPETLLPKPVSLPAITHSDITSSKGVDLPDDNDHGLLSPGMVPLPYDVDLDLREPSLGVEPLLTDEDTIVENDPTHEEPMPIESIPEVLEHAVSKAGKGKVLGEQAEEVAADEFVVPLHNKGKKAKKQQPAVAGMKDDPQREDFTEEPRSMREVKVQALPETTGGEFSEPGDVSADPNLASNQLDRQENSAALDTDNPFDAEPQRITKKGKKNRKNKNLWSPFEAETTLITPSYPGILSDIPGDPVSSITELPRSVEVPQPSDKTPREVQSEISTPSGGPLGRPLDMMKDLLGMSTKSKKRKGKKDKYSQDLESSSAVSEEPVASVESNREGDEGVETKQSRNSKKGKNKGRADISTNTEDTSAYAINEGSQATSNFIAVENPTMAEDQRPSPPTEKPKIEPDTTTETPFKSSDQLTLSTPPLHDSVTLVDPGEGDVDGKPKPRASDLDCLLEAAEASLPPDDPADFPIEEQNIEPEAELYEQSFSSKKSKKAKKKSKKNQASIQDHEQPTSVAVQGTAYQYPKADVSQEVTNAESDVFIEPYHAQSPMPSVGEPMGLSQLPSNEVSKDSFTSSGLPQDFITSTEGAEDLSPQTLDINKGQNLNDPPWVANETSVGSGGRSITPIPLGPDARTLAVSELPRVTIEEPNFDKEQSSAFSKESTAVNETPTVSDLELAALEAGLLKSNDGPVVYSEQQSATRSQNSTEPVSSPQEEDSSAIGSNRRAKKSKKRQKGALVFTRPEETNEQATDLYEYPEGSSALLGPSHKLNRSVEEGVLNPNDYDTVPEPSSIEGVKAQAPQLDQDLEGHAIDGNGFEEAVSRPLGVNSSDLVLDVTAASHTEPDTIHGPKFQTLTEENPADENGKESSTQKDEWLGEFTTKAKNKKGKKQRRNDRPLLAAEFTEDANTSSTSTEKSPNGSVSPNYQAVPQQLETPMQSNTAIVSLQDAPVTAVEERPSMPRQNDDFLSYASAKKGKKSKKSKKQPASPAWYDETTGSGASTPAGVQAARSEPPEAEISGDKVEDVYAELPAHVHTLPERSDVVSRYSDEFMEIPSLAEAESVLAPASKKKGKKGKRSSKQSPSYEEDGDPVPEVLPEPEDKARDTASGGATIVLPMEDAHSADGLVILDDLPALPPSRPESRMSDAAEETRIEDGLLRDQAVFEPLPASRPTSPTTLPLEGATHTELQDEQIRDEIYLRNLPALPESRPDSPFMMAADLVTQAQLHDSHTGVEIPEEIQPGPVSRTSSPPLQRSSEPLTLVQGNVISTNISEPAQFDGVLNSSENLGSQNTSDIKGVETSEADRFRDGNQFDKASRPLDATVGLTTIEALQRQPAKEKSKKEKRKNKKQKKTFDWAEQEEGTTTQSTSVNSDKEPEPDNEQTDVPSTTSASHSLEAEQPQQLDTESGYMPNRDFSNGSLSEHDVEHRERVPEKALRGSQFNRDSAVHVSDSPILPHIVPTYNPIRDSGYQDAAASPMVHSPQDFATGSELQSPRQNISRSPLPAQPLTALDKPYSTENSASVDGDPGLESRPSSRSPLGISVELDPAFEVSVSQHPPEPPRSSTNSGVSVGGWDMPGRSNESNGMEPINDKSGELDSVFLPQHDQRQPSPVESATKDRSSVLFLSSPLTMEDSRDQPTTESHWERIYHSTEETPQITPIDAVRSTDEAIEISGVPYGSRELSSPQAAAAERVPNTAASHALPDTSETPSMSLFGGPVGINSDNPIEGSLPPASFGFNGSERTPLDTIAEHSPEDSPLLKKSRTLSDIVIGSPERGIKSMRRSATPSSHGRDNLPSPPAIGRGITPCPQRHATPPNSGILSTDDFIARLSWPAVDEDNHSVDLDRAKSRNTDRRTSGHSNGSARVRDGEIRSTSGQSIRSGGSINRFITPDRDQIIRPGSGVSNRSASGTGTPPLRRVDRRLSGDLRAANKRSEAKFLAKQPDLGFDVDPHTPSSSTYDPVKDKGKGRVRGMTDVYEGWGDVPGSPLSPTRPPSVRRRQSMQIIDLETKLDQLASENRLLQDAKSKAERGIQELGYAHDRNKNAAKEAIETRDLQLREKDSEILKLRETLEWVQKEVARLTEVNESLAATNLSLSSDQDHRYSQLQLEHDTTKQQWQQSTRELEELRQQHVHLSTGMEDIVRHEISIALNNKNVETRRLRDELEAAKEQVRALQQQILASKPSDDVLITRDEDYFDSQCQQLCQHVQQWVMRFSKFSDSKSCRLTSDIIDEKITDRFDNAILDGSDVDNYLADRKRRRDVFMSVVMTMVWEFIFTRYLFGMDREQRQKLKSLEKLLGEVGPLKAVHRWRATTLMLLSRRQAFQAQRAQDTEAVVQEIFQTLSAFLPPPSQHIKQAKESLRNVMKCAVDLSIEMRTQRAEYIMLPPLQPEYDTNGDLVRKVYFNAAVMNERSGNTTSNEELEAQHAVVRIVLFPLVVKKGDDAGLGNEEIVVCPAQVLVAKPGKDKKVVRVLSGDRMSVDQATKSVLSFAPSSMDMGNMI